MNLDQIETKCFILALFIRDDGERFLLGSRAYEFVDSQLHFAANSYQNDIVEVQGNDGVMLAGQVRRGTSQAFDGYIGDSSVNRSTIEQYRRDFMQFFRKNHYYKVVYVFPDGTAVQRRNGFIVEAPEVKELYQLFPQYHISMNFEDINYYNYEEDSDGEEIYGESATLKIATAATGGLIWDELQDATLTGEGSNFTLDGTVGGNAISNVQLKGDTEQQTYIGKNLWNMTSISSASANVTISGPASDGEYSLTWTAGFTAALSSISGLNSQTSYTVSFKHKGEALTLRKVGTSTSLISTERDTDYTSYSYTFTGETSLSLEFVRRSATTNVTAYVKDFQLETGSATSYEPYVGGTASPNPDYPQEVQTVTGRQVVTVTDGGSQSQSYEVNLGKNLFDGTYLQSAVGGANNDHWLVGNNLRSAIIPCEPNTTYTATKSDSSDRFLFADNPTIPTTNNQSINYLGGNNSASSYTVTTHSDAHYLIVYVSASSQEPRLQIELGSQSTSYSTYFTPIELCKIGTYQDYIYKSGSDWYLRKEIGKKIFNGDETWTTSNSGTARFYYQTSLSPLAPSGVNTTSIWSNYGVGASITNSNTATGIMITDTGGTTRVRYGSELTIANWQAKLALTSMLLYYPLATPTDIQITNADLISQLNALAGATTYDGHTVFTVTSENQLAILALSTVGVGGGGVVWDQYGAEWEEGTGGGPTMVNIDSIDNVYPVWTLTGPAVNPQISVLTTNTTLSYSGTVTSSQELKIDMFNKTATLNGASVVGNVSGDWVYLKPGLNRITYTTNNADAPDSTLWWQEIVG